MGILLLPEKNILKKYFYTLEKIKSKEDNKKAPIDFFRFTNEQSGLILEKNEQVNDKHLKNLAVDLNRFYTNEEFLNFILTEFSFIPYFFMLFDKKEKYNNKIFYDLLNFSEIEFNIEKSTEVDKNIKTVIIKGSPSSNVKMYELKNIIIKYLNLLQHEIIRL